MGFEHFHCRSNNVEDDDDLGFFPCLKLENEHAKLDQYCGQKQEVVACDKTSTAPIPPSGQNQRVRMMRPSIAPPNRQAHACFSPKPEIQSVRR